MKGVLVFVLTVASTIPYATNYTASVFPAPTDFAWVTAMGAAGSGSFGGYGAYPNSSDLRAIVFSRSTYIDVSPDGFSSAIITDSGGGNHVGWASRSTSSSSFAYLWSGTAAINVHPAGYSASALLGIGGGKQSGLVFESFSCSECGLQVEQHAGRWNGSADSFQLLHSKNHVNTAAHGTDGYQTVGQGQRTTTGIYQALLWGATNRFAVNLHPGAGYSQSLAVRVSQGQQVGTVSGRRTGGMSHAALWYGTAASFIDLNPDGYSWSDVRALLGKVQAGCGGRDPEAWKSRALAWHSSKENVVDLHALLPARFRSWSSSAQDVDTNGNIIGFVERAGIWRPVIWKLT
jgi:hypothetical protein